MKYELFKRLTQIFYIYITVMRLSQDLSKLLQFYLIK